MVLVLNRSDGPALTFLLNSGPDIPSDPDPLDTTMPFTVDSSAPSDLSDNCAASTSSGPNNSGTDNCLWTVDPKVPFDSFSLSTTRGTVSLEGSGDFMGSAAHDTLLYLSNSAPTAGDDSFSTDEDTAHTGTVPTNDPEGDTLTTTVVTGPAHGDLALGTDGSFTYTPDPDYFGADAFTYRASDGAATDDGTVSITVDPVNDPPVAPDTPSATTDEDEPVDVTVADDIDSTDGSAVCTLKDSEGNLLDGTIENVDGFVVTVTPPANFFGTMTHGVHRHRRGRRQLDHDDHDLGRRHERERCAGGDRRHRRGGRRRQRRHRRGRPTTSTSRTTTLTAVNIGSVLPAGATAVLNPATGDVTYTPTGGLHRPRLVHLPGERRRPGLGEHRHRVGDRLPRDLQRARRCPDEDGRAASSGTFTRLTDSEDCKRYTVDADDGTAVAGDETVTFNPIGDCDGGLPRRAHLPR